MVVLRCSQEHLSEFKLLNGSSNRNPTRMVHNANFSFTIVLHQKLSMGALKWFQVVSNSHELEHRMRTGYIVKLAWLNLSIRREKNVTFRSNRIFLSISYARAGCLNNLSIRNGIFFDSIKKLNVKPAWNYDKYKSEMQMWC